ncbi:MAG: DUF1016 family protein [Prevotella sp.]|nr:DUF1016 family protein [Prevotella sp.]
MAYKTEFENIYGIISFHKKRAMKTVHNESLLMLWQVGGYVSARLKQSAWGGGVVRMLADYIRTRSPKAKGWSYRTLYKMVQFYDTYSTSSFKALVEHYGMQHYLSTTPGSHGLEFVPVEMAQMNGNAIVPFEMAQIPSVLLATGWTNHQIILNRCKTDEQRLFYILYAGSESLENKELVRMISTDAMSSVLGSKDVQSEVLKSQYPQAGVLFKDTVYLEMFGLPVRYKESKRRKEIVAHMKDFILEMGKDFLFIDDEHRLKVGGKTFKVDLLFYHRQLQCMVAIELKTTEFHPKDLGQLEFYLEALDQEERRSNENPSIGIILCRDADMEVVRFALNRSMSPTMVAQYKEQLQVGSVLQRSLVEFCNFLSEGGKKHNQIKQNIS